MTRTAAQPAAYGTWPSPVGADLVAEHDGRPQFTGTVGEELWWTAPRPSEGGRRALMRLAPDSRIPQTVLPAPWNVRSGFQEYGGQPWAGAARSAGEGGPVLVFVHFEDQRLYVVTPDAAGGPDPQPLTPASGVGGGLRWVDPVVLPEQGEVWCVLEEFTGEHPTDLRRVLAAVPLDGSAAGDRTAVRELTDDRHRFLTGPRLSPDGRHAAWLSWDHPLMPWDGTELKLAAVRDGNLVGARTVAGGSTESIPQVEWDVSGALLFASDRTGWWNLYRAHPAAADGDAGTAPSSSEPALTEPEALCSRDEEFADALWNTGMRWFAPLDDGLIAVLHGRGAKRLGLLDPEDGTLTDSTGPWTEWGPTLAAQDTRITGVAAGSDRSWEIVQLDAATGHTRVVAEQHRHPVDPAYYPIPQERTVTGEDGREVYYHFYPPTHPTHTGPKTELPPCVVRVHGGPTGRSPMVLDLEVAYFTSRGIGVAEVNYGGSTGYGRAYRNRLREHWGVVDVEDCASAVRALAADGLADPERIAIRGGSAGGWTTAASLTDPDRTGDVYACGTISYPVLDLADWASSGTHDFESHYLESLIGPMAEVPGRYRERSPAHRADRINRPFLMLQGLDDAITPPVQCENLLTALEGRDVPHAYLTFEGEGHGFRRADTIRQAVEAELSLYLQTFGIDRDDCTTLELRP